MNNVQLADKLKTFEASYTYSVLSSAVSRSDVVLRYNKLQLHAATAGTLILSLEDRNRELAEENARLKDLLYRAMEKNLIGDVDL